MSLSSPSVLRPPSRFDYLKSIKSILQDCKVLLPINIVMPSKMLLLPINIVMPSKMLLVYDGADDLSFLPEILPRSTALVSVLFTTRCDDCFVLVQSERFVEVEDAAAMWSSRQPPNSQETAATTELSVERPIEMRKANLRFEEFYQLLKTNEVELEALALALDLDNLWHYFRVSLHDVLMEANVTQLADLKWLSDRNIDELNISECDKDVRNMRNFMMSFIHAHLTFHVDIELVARDNPKASSLIEYSLCVSTLSSHNLVEWHEIAEGYTLNIYPLGRSTMMEHFKQQLDEMERKITDVCDNMLSHIPDSTTDSICLLTDVRLHLASRQYSLAKHALLAGVEPSTWLELAMNTCDTSLQFQPPDLCRDLCETYPKVTPLLSFSCVFLRFLRIKGIHPALLVGSNL